MKLIKIFNLLGFVLGVITTLKLNGQDQLEPNFSNEKSFNVNIGIGFQQLTSNWEVRTSSYNYCKFRNYDFFQNRYICVGGYDDFSYSPSHRINSLAIKVAFERTELFKIKDFLSGNLLGNIQIGLGGIKNLLRDVGVTDQLDLNFGVSPTLSFSNKEHYNILGGIPYFNVGVQYFLLPISTPGDNSDIPIYYNYKWTEHLIGAQLGIGLKIPTKFGKGLNIELNFQRGTGFSNFNAENIRSLGYLGFNLITSLEL